MVERVLMAGSGGQGIILTGRLLATVAMKEILNVTFFPSYGAEVRGGTSNCQVVLSTEEIASPVSERFDSMIIMNQASAERYQPQMVGDCLVIANCSLCKARDIPSAVSIDATDLANRLGDTRAANFIMLGAYMARKQMVSTAAVEEGIGQFLRSKSAALIDLNIRAFRAGLQL